MMSKWKNIVAGLTVAAVLSPNSAFAAATRTVLGIEVQNPSCVLMKFTDDTRYQEIDAEETLSDLVMEKLVASDMFNLKETRPIDQNMETMLYDEKMRELAGARAAIADGDLDELFEGPGFSETKAQSIATASVGQIVTPSITAPIGNAHDAEYLIQGTIINLGNGVWLDAETEGVARAAQQVEGWTHIAGSYISNEFGSAVPVVGMIAGIIGGFGQKKTAIGVQCDMRIIKASTGEVVWCKRVTGMGSQTQTRLGALIKIGSSKLNANLYAKAMDNAAQQIVDTLIEDMKADQLFAK